MESDNYGRGARATAAERQRDDELIITLQINEHQAACLASGFVPALVKAAVIDCLTWQEQLEAKARRPEPKAKRGRTQTSQAV